ncbi:MAG: methyltransferase domain-containing protein [Methanosarcinales archaeon]|nr:methyltransferase domain-containing protein [Methanosarcinales archaeon]
MLSASPTKPEILAITIAKLNLTPATRVFCDIGCGTGAVSIAAAVFADKIYAIDVRDDAIREAEQNFRDAGISERVTLIHGEAPAAIAEIPDEIGIDCAFVGGTRNVESVLRVLKTKVCGRVVANAARIETAARIIGCMKSLGMFVEVIHVQVSKGYDLAGETAFTPINPVYVVVGATSGKRSDQRQTGITQTVR